MCGELEMADLSQYYLDTPGFLWASWHLALLQAASVSC